MQTSSRTPRQSLSTSVSLAVRALRSWSLHQWLVALAAGAVVAIVIGLATVLIPNPVFARDIPPVWWNYPVWIATSVLSGILFATYVRTGPSAEGQGQGEQRTSRMGMAGGALAWFAVGCPVCNKIALLAFGYSGAITWFTPMQPFLAVGAFVLTGLAVIWRLKGQVVCAVSPQPMEVTG